MYTLPIILLAIALIFLVIFHFRKAHIIRKIKAMSLDERCELLNSLAEPFGYVYIPCQDIFSTGLNGWQREFGFMNAYDVGAPYFNMIYDYQTVYFDYEDRTWLIEMWKGQYGINTGCEIGVYHADTIIPPHKYSTTKFDAAENHQLLPFKITLWKGSRCLGTLNELHWWLTIFNMGLYSKARDLSMEISITFPHCDMLTAFKHSLYEVLPDSEINVYGKTITFVFDHCYNEYSLWKRIIRCWGSFWCKLLCRLFCFITRPFKCSRDKVLYLYFYLPFAFRKTLRLHRHSRKRG